MINSLTTTTRSNGWTNIAYLYANKKYTLSFKVDTKSQVNVHLHDDDGKCIQALPIYGNLFIANKKYSFPIDTNKSGNLALHIDGGNKEEEVTIYDICVEEN